MQKTVVELVDDIDGSPATETIRFGLDSVEYSIDLSGRNAEKLRGDMEKWVRAAQKIGGRREPLKRSVVGDLERRRTTAGLT
jgi:hypothetical protein